MKRWALSVVCGFAVPFLYAIVVAPLTPHLTNRTLDQLAMYPVSWPILILYHFQLADSFPLRSETTMLVYIIVSNALLYTLLTYFLLLGISKQKKTDRCRPSLELGVGPQDWLSDNSS